MERIKNIANLIMAEAKKYDVTYASCSVSEKETKEFNVEVGEFTLLRTLFDRGVSVSVYKDNRHGSVAINSFEEDKIIQAVKDACEAAKSTDEDTNWEVDQSGTHMEFVEGPWEPDTDKLFQRTKELVEDVATKFPKLKVESCISEHIRVKGLYMNSYDTCYENKKGVYHFSIGYAGHEGEKSSHTYGSVAKLIDLDTPFIKCNLTEKEMSDTEKQASPEALNDKFTGTVIFTPNCVDDVVFGTILGNFVSDSPLIEGTSIWKDKIGEQVADSRINLRLAPGDKRILLGQNYTGEGFLSEDFDIIRNGELKAFLLTQYAANKTGNKRSPNTSSAIICDPGEKTLDEIISGVEKGIIVGRFSGGRPGANGEFSGVAKNAFLVENGKITKALSETMISDNLPEMLFRLRDISKEVLEDGTCSIPYMAFDGVTISGK